MDFQRIVGDVRAVIVKVLRSCKAEQIEAVLNALNNLDEKSKVGKEVRSENICDIIAIAERLDQETLEKPLAEARALVSKLEKAIGEGSQQNSTFDWCDSALVRAVVEGSWLLIDNANFCCASVLDRLNGLFETGGVLTIGEQGCSGDAGGVMRTVRPHPDFRVFLIMDPRHGELSPAMRNRGVEIYVDETVLQDIVVLGQVRLILHEI